MNIVSRLFLRVKRLKAPNAKITRRNRHFIFRANDRPKTHPSRKVDPSRVVLAHHLLSQKGKHNAH